MGLNHEHARTSCGKDLAAWLEYIQQLHDKAIDPGLGRVQAVKARLGLEPAFPLITVGGTNGKGSTCAMLEAMLRHAGYRTGCYTSPHLLHYGERVRVDGQAASDAALCASFAVVEEARGDTPLTYFEFGTLAAMVLFCAENVDVAVLEVGLGGRLDAVNAFDADCAVVTSVDIDHVDYLGDTREAIGFEKAGIFRRGRPAIFADRDVPASVHRHAAETGAALACIGRDFGYVVGEREWHFWQRDGETMPLPFPRLQGEYQFANASAAIAALVSLRSRLPVNEDALHAGLRAASVPGRFQTLRGEPEVIVDVAHNPHAAAALAHNLARGAGARRTVAVCAMLADKDMQGVAHCLKDAFDAWHVAGLDMPRGASVAQLGTALQAARVAVPVSDHASPARAYAAALAEGRQLQGTRIVVFGSFHTVAAVLQAEATVGQ